MILRKPLPFVLTYIVLCISYFFVWMKVKSEFVTDIFTLLPLSLLLVGNIISIVRTGDKRLVTVTVALIFSALGDASWSFSSLMTFFALAQVCYIISFSRYFSIRSGKQIAVLAVWAVVGSIVFYLPLHSMIARGESTALIIGGCIYMALLLGMSFTAIGQTRPLWILFAVGSLVFVLSDSAIAIDRFVVKLPCRKFIVMGTYYAAQLLLNLPTSTDLIDKK